MGGVIGSSNNAAADRLQVRRSPDASEGKKRRRRQVNGDPSDDNNPDSTPVTLVTVVATITEPLETLTTIITVESSPTERPGTISVPRDDATVPGDDTGSSLQSRVTSAARSNTESVIRSTPTRSEYSSSTAISPPSETGSNGSSSGGVNNGPLIGGIVGGGLFLIIVAFLLGYCIRKRSRKGGPEANNDSFVDEIERQDGYGAGGFSAASGSRSKKTGEKPPVQASTRAIPDISIDPSHSRNRSIGKVTTQSREGLLSSDYGKLGPTGFYGSENEKRHAMAMLRRSTAQDSATIPHHLRHLRPESVSTDGLRASGMNAPMEEGDNPMSRAANNHGSDRVSKIGMALSTSDKSLQDDNISAILEEDMKQHPRSPPAIGFNNTSMYFEETPPLYTATTPSTGHYFTGAGPTARPKPSLDQRTSNQPPDLGTIGSAGSSSRFAGRSDLATPSPPGTPTGSAHGRAPSTSSRRSSKRGSGIFGLASATSSNSEPRSRTRPKSWDRKSRRFDKRRYSRGRAIGTPAGLEKRKGNKSRSRSRGNALWTAWFDSSSEGEDEDHEDVVEPIPIPGGVVTSRSQRQKKRVFFNSTSDIPDNQIPNSTPRVHSG